MEEITTTGVHENVGAKALDGETTDYATSVERGTHGTDKDNTTNAQLTREHDRLGDNQTLPSLTSSQIALQNPSKSSGLSVNNKHVLETAKTVQVNKMNVDKPITSVRERKIQVPILQLIKETSTDNGLSTNEIQLDINENYQQNRNLTLQTSVAGVYIDTSKVNQGSEKYSETIDFRNKENKPQKAKTKKKNRNGDLDSNYPEIMKNEDSVQLSPLRTRRRGNIQPPPVKYLLDNQRLHDSEMVIKIVSDVNTKSLSMDNQTEKRKNSLSSSSYSPSVNSNQSTPRTEETSMIKKNRIQRKIKQKKLKEELSRPFTEYSKDSTGDIVPTFSSKRKEFRVPSGNEIRRRKKLLEDEKNALDGRNSQIHDFYVKLEIDEGRLLVYLLSWH